MGKEKELWWCNTHQREATAIDKDGKRRCDPGLSGIMLPCSARGVVNLTGLVELERVERIELSS